MRKVVVVLGITMAVLVLLSCLLAVTVLIAGSAQSALGAAQFTISPSLTPVLTLIARR